MLAFIMTHLRTALAMDLNNIQSCLEALYGDDVTCRDSRDGQFYCARHYEVYNRYTESVSAFPIPPNANYTGLTTGERCPTGCAPSLYSQRRPKSTSWSACSLFF